MKISSRLILLISISIMMITFQFAVNRYLNSKMGQFNKSIQQLNKMSENILSAIAEEKTFTLNHHGVHYKRVLEYVQKAQKNIESIKLHSIIEKEEAAALETLIEEYRKAYRQLGQAVKSLDAAEAELDKTVAKFTADATQTIQRISSYIGMQFINAEDVDEHALALSDITRDVLINVSRVQSILNQDLLRKADVIGYLKNIQEPFSELRIQKKNARALSSFIKDSDNSNFIQSMIKVLDTLPAQVDDIKRLWSEQQTDGTLLEKIRSQLIDAKANLLISASDKIKRYENTVFWVNVFAFIFTILALLLIAVPIFRSITAPIKRIIASAMEIADGDLRYAVQNLALHNGADGGKGRSAKNDEIYQLSNAFAKMAHSLRSLIGQVQKSGIQVVTSSTEISASAGQLKDSASHQAASINQVTATSQEISSRSRELLQTMNRVMTVASETSELASDSQGSLRGIQSSMQQLMVATESIADKLKMIDEKAEGIDSIVTTITKVAAQTNLLSLNAAIEAEKAGEYGFGFSVVAREIRRLADQTAVATLDIEQMVESMQSAVSSGVAEVQTFIEEVTRGVSDVEKISDQLTLITDRVQMLIPHFETVNRSMHSQSEGAQEISKAMVQLSETAELTEQIVREFKTATEQLTEAAHTLQSEVSKFKVDS